MIYFTGTIDWAKNIDAAEAKINKGVKLSTRNLKKDPSTFIQTSEQLSSLYGNSEGLNRLVQTAVAVQLGQKPLDQSTIPAGIPR